MDTRASLEAALRPLAARMAGVVSEHEVLRIAATVHGKDTEKAAGNARREVLAWTQNRCGGRLPLEAWECESFEYLAGGRNSLGVRLRTDDADIWGIRAEDPDKQVAGRIWTTEVIIGAFAGQRARFSTRQLVSTTEESLQIEPHAPGFLRQIVDKCGLSVGTDDVEEAPSHIEDEPGAFELLSRLLDPERSLPYLVLTGDARTGRPNAPLLDAGALARAVVGMAHVAIVGADQSRILSAQLGSVRSVFHGGVRLYLPGFSLSADPYRHPLFTSDRITRESDQMRAVRWLRSLIANESIRRNRLGREVLAFGDIRNATLRAKQERLASEGASDTEQLIAARSTIIALERRLDEERAAQEYFDAEARNEKDRAEAAETQLRAANFYIQQLQAKIQDLKAGANPDQPPPLPEGWADLADWCDMHLAGCLSLAPLARRGAKDAEFEDFHLAARCLVWLAGPYRKGRINGADGDFRDVSIEDGVRNSPCGGDEFEIDWQGRRHTVDWHVKSGGNTRDPRRCLRIYYFWEPEIQQVVVADMPHHRRSAAT